MSPAAYVLYQTAELVQHERVLDARPILVEMAATCLAWAVMSVVMAGDESCDLRKAWIKPVGLCVRCIAFILTLLLSVSLQHLGAIAVEPGDDDGRAQRDLELVSMSVPAPWSTGVPAGAA